MSQATLPRPETMADLLEQLGGIDPGRVRLRPAPGKATEKDLIRLLDRTGRLYELVDGMLVEKVMGFPESFIAAWLIYLLETFNQRRFGFCVGEAAAMRLMPGMVRMPDVSFVCWDRVPVRGQVPRQRVAGLAPDLAVEVLSKGNTPAEMRRKLKEYFRAGVRLVWFIDPRPRTVVVYTGPDQPTALSEEGTLDGGDVLPGLSLPIRSLFEHVEPQPAQPKRRRKGNSSAPRGRRGKGKPPAGPR